MMDNKTFDNIVTTELKIIQSQMPEKFKDMFIKAAKKHIYEDIKTIKDAGKDFGYSVDVSITLSIY